MLIALFIKEWREKALIFFFELGLLVLLIGAQFFVQNQDLREWLVYAVLMLFFPFAALILGAAGFEAEYRHGAWAYLFSRPIRRSSIWLAKFGALLTMFTVLWLVFLAAWAALPEIRSLAAGPREILEYIVADGFPWWSLGLTLFLLVVAFSLSIIHERQLQLMFLSLVLGLFLMTAAWALTVSKAAGFMAWLDPAKALRTLLLSLVLIAFAFIGASLSTLVRSDFSQPRNRTRTYVAWFVPLLILAVAITVATALWVPMPAERSLYHIGSYDGKAFFRTERGIIAYDAKSGDFRRLTHSKHISYLVSSFAAGHLAYLVYDVKSAHDAVGEVWVVNADGSGRARVLGRDAPAPWPADPDIQDILISPDGRKVAVLTRSAAPQGSHKILTSTLWTANADGSGLEKLHAESWETTGGYSSLMTFFVGWGRQGNALLIRTTVTKASSKVTAQALWLYDVDARTMSKIQDDAVPASWRESMRPGGDLLAIRYPTGDRISTRRLALLDLSTMERTDIAEGPQSTLSRIQWDPSGERMSYCMKRTEPGGRSYDVLAIYSLPAHRTVAEKVIAMGKSEETLSGASWMPDGRSLVSCDSEDRRLIFLGPDLQETGRIDLPARIKKPWGLTVIGNQVLIGDSATNSLWRLDLKTKSWKKIY
jgi:ABC-type transport system involved in multi-copper enzyme maturation permease subunit